MDEPDDMGEQLRAERDGWRQENDRHRALYVEAVKERDALRTPEQRIMRDLADDQALWHLINQLADNVEGIDGNVIRGWLDATVREAVMGGIDGVG